MQGIVLYLSLAWASLGIQMSLQLMVILLPHSLSQVLRLQAQALTFALQVVFKDCSNSSGGSKESF